MTLPKTDLDSPWKDILRAYFPQAIEFFFPNTAALIDWSKPHEFLDKEFQKISQDAEVGRRFADQLVKVWLKDGESIWLLIHLEVQSHSETGFEERMFIYCLRIFDQFRQIPTSLAILCDESQTWRPERYGKDYPDTSLNFRFGTVKLIDFRARWEELEQSDNPFATVVMAHLKMMETRPDAVQRKNWKLSLIRALYDRGLQRQEIQNLYRFIDWVMILPEGLEKSFWQELKTFEEERKVTYVTTGERIGYAQGAQEGRREEAQALVLRQLTRRIGNVDSEVRSQIQALPLTQLEALSESLLDFSQPNDLKHWLQANA
jgi:hypothetical protein